MKKNIKCLNQENLKDLVRGACLLGSGGGGGYKLGMKLAGYFPDDDFYADGSKEVCVLPVDKLPENYCGVVVAYMGAPAKGALLRVPDAAVAAVNEMARKKGRKINYILPIELGACSTLFACLVAAKLNTLLVDCDGAGRAVPTLELILYGACGASVNPTILASEKVQLTHNGATENQFTSLEISGDKLGTAAAKIEALARQVLSQPEYDYNAGLAMWFMDEEDTRRLSSMCIPNTVTMCYELGEVIRKEQEARTYNAQRIIDKLNQYDTHHAAILYKGKLESASTETSGGFDVGKIIVKTDQGAKLRLIFLNETLLIWDSEESAPRITAPDLISYLIVKPGDEGEQQWVYSNDDIMQDGALREELQNADIEIIGIEAPQQLKECGIANVDLFNIQDGTPGNSLLDYYMNILNKLGFHGKYIPLEVNSR